MLRKPTSVNCVAAERMSLVKCKLSTTQAMCGSCSDQKKRWGYIYIYIYKINKSTTATATKSHNIT